MPEAGAERVSEMGPKGTKEMKSWEGSVQHGDYSYYCPACLKAARSRSSKFS